MSDLVVLDTTVLQKANAPIESTPGANSKFVRRLRLLQAVRSRDYTVLISPKLLHEYRQQVREPRNEYVRAFFELLADPDSPAVPNWPRWSGRLRDFARECRFPREDYHVLRTAIHKQGSTILSEESRMLVTDACIHRKVQVHVVDPTA